MSIDGRIVVFDFISRYYKDLRFQTLERALQEYYSVIEDKIELFSFDNPTSVIRNLKTIKGTIIEAEKDFLSGLIGDCYDKIYNLMFRDYNIEDLGIVWEIDKDMTFFRMRTVNDQYLLTPQELNHIPFNKRDNISNQRYSLSGFPCLYLGSSIYVCWEELMRPNINTANIASFVTKRPLKLVNFDYCGFEHIFEHISCEQLIYRTLFKVATSITRKEITETKFKREYIIPQAILHSIIKWNRNNDIRFDGIAYLSTRYEKEGLIYKQAPRFLNIVIPTMPCCDTKCTDAKNDYCKHIEELFEQQGPISLSIFNILRPENCYIPPKGFSDPDPYTDSELYRLESYLRQKYNHAEYFWECPNRHKRVSALYYGTME